uniref:F-box protein 4 n=1 Tax=Sphenodon punctatus TaxID=8508 RepID=A0A8D0HIF0_SPHPU
MAAAGNAVPWGRLESALRLLREKWGRGGTGQRGGDCTEPEAGKEGEPSRLQALPIDVQLYIMSFLSPQDLCHLGSTNRYWMLGIQDPLLWRYFLLRDLPSWPTVDWKSLPDMEIFNRCFSELNDSALYDYMTVYKQCCLQRKRRLKSSRPTYGPVTSFLQSLVSQEETRFAMFGPGLEELDESLVHRMMTQPEILPIAGLPPKPIHGIGSGISFRFNNHQKFNILTLYSMTSRERAMARAAEHFKVNKMFCQEDGENQQTVRVPIDQVKQACKVVDGFIYVANAESHTRHNRQEEFSHILAMLDPALGPVDRPMLVLSCISHVGVERISCVHMAHQLQLNLLGRPWMVQDTEAVTLAGLLNGIEWLLGEAAYKNAQ